MSTRLVLPVAVAAAIALGFGVAPALAAELYEGTIAAIVVEENRLDMTSAEGEAFSFTVQDGAEITLDGEEAALADFQAGWRVEVTAELEGETYVAQMIHAFSEEAPEEVPEEAPEDIPEESPLE